MGTKAEERAFFVRRLTGLQEQLAADGARAAGDPAKLSAWDRSELEAAIAFEQGRIARYDALLADNPSA